MIPINLYSVHLCSMYPFSYHNQPKYFNFKYILVVEFPPLVVCMYVCLYFIPETSKVLTDHEHILFPSAQFLLPEDNVSLCRPGSPGLRHSLNSEISLPLPPTTPSHRLLIDWLCCAPLPCLFTDQMTTCCVTDTVSWVTENLGSIIFPCLSTLFGQGSQPLLGQ